MNTSSRPRILIVEDNPGDVFLFEECLRESKADVDLAVANEVEEGIRLLDPARGSIPSLALIDLHLPRRDGKYLLTFLRDQPHLKGMPAVVLSSSQRATDRETCLGLGAREVLTKPSDWKGYATLVAQLSHYWTGH